MNQHFTPHRTHEHLAIKLHLLAACVRKAGESAEKDQPGEKEKLRLETLIKNLLRGADPHGLPKGACLL